MKFIEIASFSFRNLRLNPVRSFLTILGVVIGITLFVFFTSLSAGIRQAALAEAVKTFGKTQIVVKPDFQKIGIFEIDTSTQFQLNKQTTGQFKNIAGVNAVYPELSLGFPTSARIHMFGYDFQTDAPISGVDPELFRDIPDIYDVFASTEDDFVPVLISPRLLDLYNSSIATSNNLPRLNEDAIKGVTLDLLLNESSFFRKIQDEEVQKRSVQAKIVGLTERAPIMGLTIPLSYAEEYLIEFKDNLRSEDILFHTAHVLVNRIEDVEPVSLAIKKMGFFVASAKEAIDQINHLLGYFFIIFSAITTVVLVVAVCSIVNTVSMSVFVRRREIGILRSCGATQSVVSLLFFCESLFIGLIGGLSGIFFGLLASFICDYYLLYIIPDLSYKPDSFFAYHYWIFPLAIVLALLISSIGGFFPSRKAAQMDPVRALHH